MPPEVLLEEAPVELVHAVHSLSGRDSLIFQVRLQRLQLLGLTNIRRIEEGRVDWDLEHPLKYLVLLREVGFNAFYEWWQFFLFDFGGLRRLSVIERVLAPRTSRASLLSSSRWRTGGFRYILAAPSTSRQRWTETLKTCVDTSRRSEALKRGSVCRVPIAIVSHT